MIIRPLLLAAGIAVLPLGALAQIALPSGASLRMEDVTKSGSYALPVAAHNGDVLPSARIAGAITRRAYRVGGTGLSSFQIILGLRQQLIDDGFEIVFECDAKTCGGYDFRFDTEVLGEPEMHVDLGDFQFLSARMPGADGQATSLLVSRSTSAAYIQVINVDPTGEVPFETVTSTKASPSIQIAPPVSLDAIGPAMEDVGRYILADLDFETGSAKLGADRYESLGELAAYLSANPDKRVALVGHTDAQGSLSANINISEQRAVSVMNRLIEGYNIPKGQLQAKGIGYLAPIASNQTEGGRTQNRRVEAILISTE